MVAFALINAVKAKPGSQPAPRGGATVQASTGVYWQILHSYNIFLLFHSIFSREEDLFPIDQKLVSSEAFVITYYCTTKWIRILEPERQQCKNKPRGGRPPVTNDRGICTPVRFVRLNPKARYTQSRPIYNLPSLAYCEAHSRSLQYSQVAMCQFEVT